MLIYTNSRTKDSLCSIYMHMWLHPYTFSSFIMIRYANLMHIQRYVCVATALTVFQYILLLQPSASITAWNIYLKCTICFYDCDCCGINHLRCNNTRAPVVTDSSSQLKHAYDCVIFLEAEKAISCLLSYLLVIQNYNFLEIISKRLVC